MRWLACLLAIAALALPGVAQAAAEKPDPGGPGKAGSWVAKVVTPTVGRAAPPPTRAPCSGWGRARRGPAGRCS